MSFAHHTLGLAKPRQIATDDRVSGAFNRATTEAAARWIVRLCQEKDEWWPFRLAEIQTFYAQHGGIGKLDLTNLVDAGWLTEEQGEYCISAAFVKVCFKYFPLSQVAQAV